MARVPAQSHRLGPVLAVVGVSLYRRQGMVEISWELLAGFVIYVICTVVALARPSRGVQDVIAGTWVVPR